MTFKNIFAFALLFTLAVKQNCFAQTFLNGSFETNTAAACDYNMLNASFTAKMANAVAYGSGNELDIMQTSCPYGPSQSGTWFVALAFPGGGTDAFTMQLSAPLVMGNSYIMRFYDKGDIVCCSPGMPVMIGISTVAGAVGTNVYTGPTPTNGVWNLRCFTFTAPNNGAYVSVSTTGPTRWSHVDNFAIVTTCAVLPIELKEFTATCVSNATVLKWSTASEKNNDRFIIEKTTNGNDFIEIGTVKGSGNSTTSLNYTFVDEAVNDGLAYYRLKQIDKDNTSTFSPLVTPEPCDPNKEFGFDILPNPANTSVSVMVKNCKGNCHLQISNPIGTLVYDRVVENVENTINISDMEPGFYTVKIVSEEKTLIQKFIKN